MLPPTQTPAPPPTTTPTPPLPRPDLDTPSELRRPTPLPAPGKNTSLLPGRELADADRPNNGLLSIRVPAGAKVYINGHQTRSTGGQREYVSHGLKQGKYYRYEIRALVPSPASLVSDGPQEDRGVWVTKTVTLTAGDRIEVSLDDVAVDQALAATGQR